MRSLHPLLISCLLLSGLTACSTRPQRDQQPSAAALVQNELLPGKAAAEYQDSVITDLPQITSSGPQTSVNQSGALPVVNSSRPDAPDIASPNDIVRLQYEQIDLRIVLEELFDTLGMSSVVDSSIADKVTLRTSQDKPLHMSDIWPLIHLLINDAGITMEKKGSVYHLKKAQDALPVFIGSENSRLARSAAPEVMQITPLRYISLDAASAALKPLVEPSGRIASLPTLNLLGITASPERLRRINNLLSLLDADPFRHRGLRLYRLNNAKASELKDDLEKILKAVEGANPAYEVVPLERINSVLVVAPPKRGFEEVTRWVDILDEANDAGGEQVFIYRVRHLKATTLASTLSEVFQVEDKEEPRKRDEQTANPDQKQDAQAETQQPDNQTKRTEIKRTELQGGDSGKQISAELKVGIVADEDTNSLLVRATPRDYRQLLETIRILDTVPKEVMVNAVIAEVELTQASRFGIDWSLILGGIDDIVMTNFGIDKAFKQLTSTTTTTTDTETSTSLSGIVVKQTSNKLTAILNAVATDNDVSLLSRPSLLVKDNQEASINVGSDEPTITRTNTSLATASSSTVTSNEVQYRQTGITLNITPHINADGIINMEVEQEVSSLGTNKTIQDLPSFNQRKIKTSIVVRDGTAIVLGGLIQTSQSNSRSGVPVLHELPVFGDLFADTGKQIIRTELVVIIIPQIINPEADNRLYVQRFNERMGQLQQLLSEDYVPIWIDSRPEAQMPPTVVPTLKNKWLPSPKMEPELESKEAKELAEEL